MSNEFYCPLVQECLGESRRRLCAAETVDFTQGDVVEAVRASHPGGVDAVLDVVSGLPPSGT